jgi:antitoxin (DNA-binding transcriptional repressor) of toxin-antitoxin stability system
MRSVSIREFRARLADHLDGEPLLIARHGRNVAIVYSLRHPSTVPLEVRRSIVDSTAGRLNVHPEWPLRSPVIAIYKRDVDRTLIRENLRRTPEERLRALQEMQRFAEELRRAR